MVDVHGYTEYAPTLQVTSASTANSRPSEVNAALSR
jgi:hypothetical protein